MNKQVSRPSSVIFIAIFASGIVVLLKHITVSGDKYRNFLQIKRIVLKNNINKAYTTHLLSKEKIKCIPHTYKK